ncbi:hypothetical protein [Coleofasciculus sp. F4-SAH-05]
MSFVICHLSFVICHSSFVIRHLSNGSRRQNLVGAGFAVKLGTTINISP